MARLLLRVLSSLSIGMMILAGAWLTKKWSKETGDDSVVKQVLLFQRTGVWFPAPTLSGSKPPVTLAPRI